MFPLYGTYVLCICTLIPLPAPPPQKDTWEDTPPIPDTTVVGMCSPQLLLHRSQSSGGHTVGHLQDSDYTQGGRGGGGHVSGQCKSRNK